MMADMKRVYLDHAAATPVDPQVLDAMQPFFSKQFGNAGGLYEEGRLANKTLEFARETIARVIGARAEEIIFTSGGTESDNLAIFGVAGKQPAPRCHIITTAFEHHAVLHPCQRLEKEGFDVTYLDVGEDGIVDPNDVKKALRPETILVTIMYANNEIGTIQPIREIAETIKEYRTQNKSAHPYFHTDACQAAGYLNINVCDLGVDMMTVNASKIYGPKGIGMLYRAMGVPLKPMIVGGGQEMRMRGGTENIPLVVGFAKALQLTQDMRVAESKRLSALRDYFIKELMRRISKTVLNGDANKRLPNNVNVSILDIEGEALVLYCDAKGIAFSTGSACTSESLDPSHVILALGKPYEFAHSSMRFTLGRSTTKEDLDYVLEVLPKTTEWLRTVSPIQVDINAKSMSHPEVFAGKLKCKAKSKNYK